VVRFAADNGLAVSVRSGGHSLAGLGTNDGGIVINMRHFSDVEVLDQEKRLVRIGSGAVWGDVALKLKQYGLGLTSGDTATVGVGGLTHAGGIGWMVRQEGLTIDHLFAAEVVNGRGNIIRASKDDAEHVDLLWAVRGGAGNVGAVTHFEFIAHPVGDVHFGTLTFKFDNRKEIVTGWRDYMRIAPEELTTTCMVMPAFMGGEPTVMVLCCYNGTDQEKANAALAPLRELPELISDDIAIKPYTDILEEGYPPEEGTKVVARSLFMCSFSDEAIDIIVSNPNRPYMIRSLGGAMSRVSPDATAFAHRDSEVMLILPAFARADATEEEIAAALEPWSKLKNLGEGSYMGFSSVTADEEVHRVFPPATYAKLAAIKQKYDPNNIFSQNYNVSLSR